MTALCQVSSPTNLAKIRAPAHGAWWPARAMLDVSLSPVRRGVRTASTHRGRRTSTCSRAITRTPCGERSPCQVRANGVPMSLPSPLLLPTSLPPPLPSSFFPAPLFSCASTSSATYSEWQGQCRGWPASVARQIAPAIRDSGLHCQRLWAPL